MYVQPIYVYCASVLDRKARLVPFYHFPNSQIHVFESKMIKVDIISGLNRGRIIFDNVGDPKNRLVPFFFVAITAHFLHPDKSFDLIPD